MPQVARLRMALAIVCLLGIVSQARAFSQLSHHLPQPGTLGKAPTALGQVSSPKSGLVLQLEASWFSDYGYRPVRFDFKHLAGPVAGDRTIRVVFSMTDYRANKAVIEVEQSAVLKAGEDEISLQLLVPQSADLLMAWWKVEVDGKPDKYLSVAKNRKLGVGQMTQNNGTKVLRLKQHASRPTSRTVVGVSAQNNANTSGPRQASPSPWDEVVSDGFERWLAYTAIDRLVLKRSELRDIAEGDPEVLSAVRKWLLAGGMLWVEWGSNDAAGLQEIEQLLHLEGWQFLPSSRATDESISGASGWRYEKWQSRSNNPQQQIEGFVEEMRRDGPVAALGNITQQTHTSRDWYACRECGFGRILAFRSDTNDVLHARRDESRHLSMLWGQELGAKRLGVKPGEGNRDFANLLIPGVGLAPVGMFQLLITLFVLGIGPLNYWLLARRQSLHLLVVTTPIAALLLTLCMLTYGYIGDGFGVKVRVRSVSLINQQQGEAVSWSRMSHYASFAPSQGMVFSDDTRIVPILPSWESALNSGGPIGRCMVWRDGEQVLSEGWLPTRTAVQHLAIRSRKSDRRLAIAESDAATSVVNQLGAEIEKLYLLDSAGVWRRGEDIGVGESQQLAEVDKQSLLAELRVHLIDNEPALPVGAGEDADQTLRFLGMSRSSRRMRNPGSTRLDGNLMNRFLDQLVGLQSEKSLDLPPRSYIAITHTSVETPLGVDNARELGSFHVVVGRWEE